YGSQTTAREVLRGISLTGKVAVVTGGYSGLGLETTRVLAEAGAVVIVPARTLEKARELTGKLPGVEVEEMDLINPNSVDAFAQRFLDSGRQLNILINNAGIMAPPLVRDSRGFESQFATNHLGHFQLTVQLWPALKKANGARVVSVSSTGIRFGSVNFDDPNFIRHDYDKWKAYGQSKTANALFAVALDRRGFSNNIRSFSVHPGRILTDLSRYLSDIEQAIGGEYKSIEQGAATSIWCATSYELDGKGGVYCMDCNIAAVISNFHLEGTGQMLTGVLPWAIDPDSAEHLWQLSEVMTGIKFKD
ncbi:MAG: SDR family NAD(P)-dependent oxidoreductase, partial [Ignavibacteriaceae bacterium]